MIRQHDQKTLLFLVNEGPDGCPSILSLYLGETRTLIPTWVSGMVLFLFEVNYLQEFNCRSYILLYWITHHMFISLTL